MAVSYEFDEYVVLVTGGAGALGSAVAEAFSDAGATVCVADVVDREEAGDLDGRHYYQGDFTDEAAVAETVEAVVADHGRLDALCNVAGTWRGGSPIDETDVEEFEFLMDLNAKTTFLASKHALPHLRETEGAIVSVSSKTSLSGGTGDGPYRASKAAVRLLTETIAEENRGVVRANAILPSVIDTAMNREMMPDADFSTWVDPADIAKVVLFLCSPESGVTSGASVPVYGEA
jgi:NAD(P)-dependent dehydrogenase (short-subunit alcohol dehydrogenase family)